MTTNTQVQGRTYYTEREFPFTPLNGDDELRAMLRWEMELQRQLFVGDVTRDAIAKQAAFDAPRPFRPSNAVAPVITGIATVGSILTVSNGTWSTPPVPTYMYRWFVNGTAVAGQTSSTFTAVQGRITAEVRATNPSGASVRQTSVVTVPGP